MCPRALETKLFEMNSGKAVKKLWKQFMRLFLNSIVKLYTKIHAGIVQNMKFSKEMFSTYRDKTGILLKTYWEKGGIL